MMLKTLIFILAFVLIFIIIIGEKNFEKIEITEKTALLPETEEQQAEPVTFSEKLAAGDQVTIVFLGDYVTSADSLPDGNPNHVALLANWFDDKYPDQVKVVNAGMNANTVSHMKDRVASDVLNQAPDLVVISAGLNDALGNWKIPVEEYKKNYQLIVDEITISGDTEVLIRTPNPTTSIKENIKMLSYMRASRELAAEKSVHFFDFYQVMSDEVHAKEFSQSSVMQNALYPNTKGQAYLFDKFKVYFTMELIDQ
ncbi:G-D-S-L family lipolytic protein [Planococcus antarcticus DSM 14505]|uniref:G-D-S-L family lipolytic protein n=1 Tax=Planococcus antarcticus DSM 14505 TaxID=1185653 RepID=A0A1C7DFH3_9BACL|nr:GDSL-type esterase/lipase family protein [Planococcus antarcticus]ANU10162.1 GDSL family lipase [Planococcus antarcticus DSM 14505]EIM06110.1 G-D-S-L family lipolytic protein [Planococcus antarcticus DSM 14505]